MKEGDVVLARLQQADGVWKLRPALIIRQMPGFGDFLLCGLSTQLQHEVHGFDETISADDPDFVQSGLLAPSVIRLGFLATASHRDIAGSIGSISQERHAQLMARLIRHLQQYSANEFR